MPEVVCMDSTAKLTSFVMRYMYSKHGAREATGPPLHQSHPRISMSLVLQNRNG